eukprot:COSAG05_NODE_62_length_23051_cov_19.660291_13_plen_88_part_00
MLQTEIPVNLTFSSVKSYISAQKTFHLDVFLLVRPKDLPLMSRALKAAEKASTVLQIGHEGYRWVYCKARNRQIFAPPCMPTTSSYR